MADVKISALTELTTPADTDELNIVDKSDTSFASTGTNKRIKVENLRGASAAQVTAIEANTAKVGITDAQADAIQQNTAKHGLYEFHANAVGKFRGVSGNPGDSTVIASGTAQFDGGALYLSNTDVDGNNITVALAFITSGTITIAGLTGTVAGNSQNTNRTKIDVNWTGNTAPLAAGGHIYTLFTGNANITEYGVYTDDTSLEKNGSQEEPMKVKARGINTDHLDTPTNGSVGQVIKRTQGANTMAWEDETTELPAVTTADNGDVLTVVAGAWNKAAAPSGGGTSLPTVTSADNGEVLTVVNGSWAAANIASGGTSTNLFTRDVLATQSTFAATNAGLLNANIDLASGKTLIGHEAFIVSFKYTHTINFSGHNFSTTNEFSKIYDGNVFRSFTGGKQPLEEVYESGNAASSVKFSIQRSTDTRVTVSFLSSDTARVNATITDFEITGVTYGTSPTIAPAYSSTQTYNQGNIVRNGNNVWACLANNTTGQTPAEGSRWTQLNGGGSTSSHGSSNSFLAVGNGETRGMFIYNNHLYVQDSSTNGDRTFRAYGLTNKVYNSSADITFASGPGNFGDRRRNFVIAGTTLWIQEGSFAISGLRAYSLTDGSRDAAKDITTQVDGQQITYMWTDGTYIWQLNAGRTMHCYNITTKTRDTSRETNPDSAPSLFQFGVSYISGRIYDYNGNSYSFNTSTGVIGSFTAGISIANNYVTNFTSNDGNRPIFAISGNTLYRSSGDDRVYAFDISTNQPIPINAPTGSFFHHKIRTTTITPTGTFQNFDLDSGASFADWEEIEFKIQVSAATGSQFIKITAPTFNASSSTDSILIGYTTGGHDHSLGIYRVDNNTIAVRRSLNNNAILAEIAGVRYS